MLSKSRANSDVLATGERQSPGTALFAYLQLMRPANMITAMGDVLAGYTAVLAGSPSNLPWLLGATLGLYGGGVVFNDFFDRRLDAVERPERPIPSGRATASGAAALGAALLGIGVACAFRASTSSGLVAVAVVLAVLAYDASAKHHHVLGPAVMGLCRGLNLLLGITAAPALIGASWFLIFLPVIFVAAITTMSAGEVHGGSRRNIAISLALFLTAAAGVAALALRPGFQLLPVLPFLAFLAWRAGRPAWRAYTVPEPSRIRAAVRAGVLSLIALDAAIAAGFGGLVYGAAVLCLTIPAMGLARVFAVT